MTSTPPTLRVNEIVLTVQGEGTRAGLPCTLVRLTGCNLSCSWCDTPHARTEGSALTLDEILRRVAGLGCRRVEVTGGEPLIQPAAPELLRRLLRAGCQTLLETNGSIDLSPVERRVIKIVDFKCPSSGEAASNCWQNVHHLTRRDEAKFVLSDREDYEFARAAVARHGLLAKCAVIFSPVFGRLRPATLAGWILADGLDVRLGLQLHKLIWPDRDRGV